MEDELIVEGGSLPVKKQFLNRVFFPIGAYVCRRLGMIPTSTDVAMFEQQQAHVENIAGFNEWSDFIIERARWYAQGYEAIESDPDKPVESRSLEEHLCAFALSIMTDERMLR